MRDMIYCEKCGKYFCYIEGCYCEQRKWNEKFLKDNNIKFNDILTLKNQIKVVVLPDKDVFFKCTKTDDHSYSYSIHNIKCSPIYRIIEINGAVVDNIKI